MLRLIKESDVTERYLSWFRDKRVTRYLEVENVTRQEAIEYIRTHKHLYAIIADKHIGNLKIGPIDWKHKLSDLITVIGDPEYWGKGYATEAVRQGIEMAFSMGIRKISAGIYSDNTGSLKAYTRAGFVIEGVLKEHYLLDGKTQDRICVGIWNPACK